MQVRNREKEIRSFKGFLDNQKKQTHKKVNSDIYNLISIDALEDGKLAVAGNQKQLKSK